jgi:hypothetical protein
MSLTIFKVHLSMGKFDFMLVLSLNLTSDIGTVNIHPAVNTGVENFSHLMRTEIPSCFVNSR